MAERRTGKRVRYWPEDRYTHFSSLRNKIPWEPSDYEAAYICPMNTRMVDYYRNIASDSANTTVDTNYIPGYGIKSDDWDTIYPKPLLLDEIYEKGPVAILTLETFGIPWDEATEHVLIGPGEPSDCTCGNRQNVVDRIDQALRGYLKTLDIRNMPAMNAIQLSCAERLQDQMIVECYINPTSGKAEFIEIGAQSNLSPNDVRYTLPSDQYSPKIDLVIVIGYDPPAYQWFWPDWFDVVAPGSSDVICPGTKLGGCGLDDCQIEGYYDHAYVPYEIYDPDGGQLIGLPYLTGSFLDDHLNLYELAPHDSFVGFVWSIDHPGGDDFTITHSETTPFFHDFGTVFWPGRQGGPFGSGDIDDCGNLTQPSKIRVFAEDKVSWNPDTEEYEGDIAQVNKWIWIGNVIKSVSILQTGENPLSPENVLIGDNVLSIDIQKEVGVYSVPNVDWEINEERTNVLYGLAAPWSDSMIEAFDGTPVCEHLVGQDAVYTDQQGVVTEARSYYSWGLCGAQGDFGGLICKFMLEYTRNRPSFIVTASPENSYSANDACDVAAQLSVKVLPLVQSDPPPPTAFYSDDPEFQGLLNEFSCIGDGDPSTQEDFEQTHCYKLENKKTGNVFQAELPFLDACESYEVAKFLWSVNNGDKSAADVGPVLPTRTDSVQYICGPNATPKLGDRFTYSKGGREYDGIVNSIEYSYTDSSSYLINVTAGPNFWRGGSSNNSFMLETENITLEGEVISEAGNGYEYVVRVPKLGDFFAFNLAQSFGSFTDIDVGDKVSLEIRNNPKWTFRGRY